MSESVTNPLLSIHRLPKPYRWALTLLWLMPTAMFIGALLLQADTPLNLFDPRLTIPLLLMALPAAVVWRQGVDVYADGLLIRDIRPNYYTYLDLSGWNLHPSPEGRILTIWAVAHGAVLRTHAAHLSDLPALLHSLETKLPDYPR